MVLYSPGMSLESVEIQAIQEAIAFYKDEVRAAETLKITHKELLKKLKRISDKQAESDKLKEIENQKHQDFVLRARGMGSIH